MAKFISIEEAVKLIPNGATVGVGGFCGFGAPDSLLIEMGKQFEQTGAPRDLSVVTPASAGDGREDGWGMSALRREGQLKALYTSVVRLPPAINRAVNENKIAGYFLPLGLFGHLFRALAGGEPGVITHVGLDTYCDPRLEGCMMNEKARESGVEIARLMPIDGKEYLFYPTIPMDIALIRGTYADEDGNVSMEKEAVRSEFLELANAVHNSGGIVIVDGGDFRQATYRAVRQGLMQAESVLLEPFYNFRIEVPQEQIGRAMADIKKMYGTFDIQPEQGDMAVLTGSCPVATMKEYPVEVASYTRGRGHVVCSSGGYHPCHNADEVIEQIGYDCEGDVENTADSVFCAHGSGFVVRWDEVKEYMHVESVTGRFVKTETAFDTEPESAARTEQASAYTGRSRDFFAEEKELEAIFEQTFGPVKRRLETPEKRVIRAKESREHVEIKEREPMERYLLVDGYNIIFAWEELNELSKISLDAARTRLMDILCNYQGYTSEKLILVFDAYKVKGNPGSVETYHNISVVYTKEAETADMYIEKVTKKIARKHRVRVATSDGMEQMIILGHGASRISARAFREEVEHVNEQIRMEIDGKEE